MIEYTIEFSRTMHHNFSEVALGKSAHALMWTLEIEPFSAYSYNIMRNNLF